MKLRTALFIIIVAVLIIFLMHKFYPTTYNYSVTAQHNVVSIYRKIAVSSASPVEIEQIEVGGKIISQQSVYNPKEGTVTILLQVLSPEEEILKSDYFDRNYISIFYIYDVSNNHSKQVYTDIVYGTTLREILGQVGNEIYFIEHYFESTRSLFKLDINTQKIENIARVLHENIPALSPNNEFIAFISSVDSSNTANMRTLVVGLYNTNTHRIEQRVTLRDELDIEYDMYADKWNVVEKFQWDANSKHFYLNIYPYGSNEIYKYTILVDGVFDLQISKRE